MILLRIVVFLFGLGLVSLTLDSTIQTLVLPRAAPNRLSRWLFSTFRWIFDLRIKLARQQTYRTRDQIMAAYAPVTLVSLPFVWLTLVMIGYAAMYWSIGVGTPWESLLVSGSSLLTLGTVQFGAPAMTLFMFSEAMLGMILVALLIAYLPTMYSAFSERERAVGRLETPAGSPPSAVTILVRTHRITKRNRWEEVLNNLWAEWQNWFTVIDESHTSLAMLVFFRSPKPNNSWITAAGVVLDAAALTVAAVDIPHDARADLCLRTGYVALRDIADFFDIEFNRNPAPDEPISISKDEFMAVLDELESEGVPVKPDREQAWRDYAGWRVNYDAPLIQLAALTMAPYAMWVSDRSLPRLPTGAHT